MIIRSSDDHLLLITQPDHAELAGTIMSAWRRDGLPFTPQRETILLATRKHDDGWLDEDAAPLVDETSGRLVDFLHASDDVRRAVWPRGIERLADRPYAAALVAEHAVQLSAHYRDESNWQHFFRRLEQARDSYVAAAAPLTADDLQRDYFFVRMGDLLSLTLCAAWIAPQHDGEYEARLEGSHLTVTPDPFGGREVPLAVRARRLPNRPFLARRDAAAAFAAAPVIVLSGVASGT